MNPLTSISNLNSLLDGSGTIKTFSPSGQEISNGYLGTGYRIRLYDTNNSIADELKVVIYGDLSGDGFINILDLTAVKAKLLNQSSLSDVFLEAGNVSKENSSINLSDLLLIKKYILGLSSISQN